MLPVLLLRVVNIMKDTLLKGSMDIRMVKDWLFITNDLKVLLRRRGLDRDIARKLDNVESEILEILREADSGRKARKKYE